MYWYRIQLFNHGVFENDNRFVAQYKRGIDGRWQWYAGGSKKTWEEAYAILEKHANPAILAVRFVGTF